MQSLLSTVAKIKLLRFHSPVSFTAGVWLHAQPQGARSLDHAAQIGVEAATRNRNDALAESLIATVE